MTDTENLLKQAIVSAGLVASCSLDIHHNPSGLPSAWMTLASPQDIAAITTALKDRGARLATMTVFRPEVKGQPGLHRIVYHLILAEMPIAISVDLPDGVALPSVTGLFLNADWEEREMMELSAIEVINHPNPRRMFLDESIEAGVFDRLVPYSEMTNSINHEAIWRRIKDESCEAQKRRQERLDGQQETGK